MHTPEEKADSIRKVIETLDILRVKCPWDAKQTNESLRTNTVEEVYELCDALIKEDDENIKKELGDVLLHVLFYSKIGEEKGKFDIGEVAEALNAKLIFRHPHVFGDATAQTAGDVSRSWEQIKLKEKGGNRTVLAGVPEALPAVIKAYRIQEKAANVGFDWSDRRDAWEKVQEESSELCAEIERMDSAKMEEEMGDLLFSLINVCRLYGINPENALEKTNKKFITRFNYIESKAKEKGLSLKEMTLEQMDILWNEAKSL
ncbi:MAG: nucleoside triphosphate pyrophosphohydrolase [Paramuribaculum sp.]|nr:nucleoside triphosphate pyrophosphohydrolase [Paramuribaculum sp.]